MIDRSSVAQDSLELMTIILLQHPKSEVMGAHHYVHIRTAVRVEGERRKGEPSACLLCPQCCPYRESL